MKYEYVLLCQGESYPVTLFRCGLMYGAEAKSSAAFGNNWAQSVRKLQERVGGRIVRRRVKERDDG